MELHLAPSQLSMTCGGLLTRPALLAGRPSPRTELVHNINGNWSGGLRVGDFKLLKGSPNAAGLALDVTVILTPACIFH